MYKIVKRWIDIIGAICGLIFFFPLFVILALVIKLDSEGPIFFRQRRLGRDKLSIEEKAKLDGEYARQFGFLMDVKCFLWTIQCVIKKEGIQEGE